MSELILKEAQFYLNAFLWGMLLSALYDILRILRRIIRHSNFLLNLEDIFFWIAGAFLIFHTIFRYNSGKVRGPAILLVVAGMLLYHYVVSNPVVSFLTKFIINPIKKAVHFLFKGLKNIGKKVKMRIRKRNKKDR